jgi:pyruvate/2-oxoglutarate dehydrogenase complex dihydrolipoamide dehydrogenase (E3) component
MQAFDLVVIGAGSGGYAAARTARDCGKTVALVDKGPLGGLCILRGCMPSKTLIATGDRAHEIRTANELGIDVGAPVVDFKRVMERKRETIQGFADYRIAGIDTFPTFMGDAVFESPTTLRVGDMLLEAPKFVIATGSVVAPPALPGLEEAGYIDSDQALELETPPKSLIVLGGGYVGTELGQFYSRIGVPTTLILRAPHLLSGEDHDVGETLTDELRKEGITVETGAIMQRVTVEGDLKTVHFLKDGEERSASAHEIFYALGRLPNTAGLNLEAAGVETHPIMGVTVDDTMRTSNPNIFAVGDVTGKFLLVHVAIQQGEVAARNALCDGHEVADYAISKAHTVFTDPQVAVVGETERELEAAGIPFLKATYPFDDLGKAISIRQTKGFVKMLASPDDGRILGVQIVGQNASDMIHIGIVAMYYKSTVFEYLKIPHLHPTMAEILTYPAEELVAAIETARHVPVDAHSTLIAAHV